MLQLSTKVAKLQLIPLISITKVSFCGTRVMNLCCKSENIHTEHPYPPVGSKHIVVTEMKRYVFSGRAEHKFLFKMTKSFRFESGTGFFSCTKTQIRFEVFCQVVDYGQFLAVWDVTQKLLKIAKSEIHFMPLKGKPKEEDPEWVSKHTTSFFENHLGESCPSDVSAFQRLKPDNMTKGLCFYLFTWISLAGPPHLSASAQALFLVQNIPLLQSQFNGTSLDAKARSFANMKFAYLRYIRNRQRGANSA